MKVDACATCNAPVVQGYLDDEGRHVWLDLNDVPGGLYEIVAKGVVQRRMTAKGQPRQGGRGLRIHTCPKDLAPGGPVTTGATMPADTYRPPQRKPKVDPTDGYVDCTGATLGKAQCAVCASPIIVAAHHLRPDGERPVLLDAMGPLGSRPWRVFAKIDAQDRPLAMFLGDDEPRATYRNHRTVCKGAKPV